MELNPVKLNSILSTNFFGISGSHIQSLLKNLTIPLKPQRLGKAKKKKKEVILMITVFVLARNVTID